jgi:hypothetical protein
MHVLNMLVRHQHQFVTVSHQHPYAAHFPLRTNADRSSPTEWRNCSHWHSCQSVRRPGTFLHAPGVHQARLQSVLLQHIVQWNPVDAVDSMATVVMPQLTSHPASFSKSSVKVGNTRTAWDDLPDTSLFACRPFSFSYLGWLLASFFLSLIVFGHALPFRSGNGQVAQNEVLS